MSQTILVVDDEAKLREMVRLYLEREGFRVVEAANGREALFAARYEKPDLVLLDLMMPEMGGYDFIRQFTKESEAPIIVLTARIEESDKVVGLELGADDYVTKPFGVQELMARVRAVLRRAGQKSRQPEILRAAEISLDRSGRTVTVSGNPVPLTPSEFDLLETFMLSPGRAFSRLDLLESVSGDAYEGYERSIDVHVRNLRTKIEQLPSKPRYIQTVYGMGYRFSAEAT
ncbi:MAG: response regulator transcription factor [Caldilineaceae bacterium SB0675_bin_29]|uniref:Response regulator transcription factor n=1 Tax=Caldilineaceae bacterium SB0675_bin_29 TaxID=2605266 RepID=A0A6B1G7L5_9CHLR|nr:response regulator transcription factor [Caldilineaceae bacterium SB0675_bin_29]